MNRENELNDEKKMTQKTEQADLPDVPQEKRAEEFESGSDRMSDEQMNDHPTLDSAPDADLPVHAPVLDAEDSAEAETEEMTVNDERTIPLPKVSSESASIDETVDFSKLNVEGKSSSTTDADRTERKANKKKSMTVIGMGALALLLAISSLTSSSSLGAKNEELADAQAVIDSQSDRIDSLQAEVYKLEDEIDEIKNGPNAKLIEVKNAYEAGDYDKVATLYDEMHKTYNGSPEDVEAGKLAKDAADKKAAKEAEEKAKAEEEARRKAEEEARGYETGITYDQLARTPEQFEGKKVKFTGKVVQVMKDDYIYGIRLAVNSNYDTILYGIYDEKLVSSRILEDDIITIYGTSGGDYTYETVMGNELTIPLVMIEKIDQ